MPVFDLSHTPLRELNSALHNLGAGSNDTLFEVVNPRGHHAVAVGIDGPVTVEVKGSVGYYCAGMNDGGTVTVDGSAGPGVAENMMSGTVVIEGDASQYAGATGRGGLLGCLGVIDLARHDRGAGMHMQVDSALHQRIHARLVDIGDECAHCGAVFLVSH